MLYQKIEKCSKFLELVNKHIIPLVLITCAFKPHTFQGIFNFNNLPNLKPAICVILLLGKNNLMR